MIDHAFNYVANIIFLVGLDNIRSQRAVEKIGASLNGKRIDGSGTESLEFRITKSDWSKNI